MSQNLSIGAAGWTAFFTAYFAQSRLTQHLVNYLFYPTVHWLAPQGQDALQQALPPVLLATLNTRLSQGLAQVNNSIATDSLEGEHIYSSFNFLGLLAAHGLPARKAALRVSLLNHVTGLPDFYHSGHPINITLYPHLGPLRRRVWRAIQGRKPNGPSEVQEVSSALSLSGLRHAILANHGVLVCDNDGLDDSQLGAIDRLLNDIPSLMHDSLNYLTANEFLGIVSSAYAVGSEINIFGARLGVAPGNSFPADVTPINIDLFHGALAHEINHMVDGYYIELHPALKPIRNQLIASAGFDSLNYIRSMIPSGTFQQLPHEFIASLSNAWFTNSAHTFRVGRVRFDAGRREPLRQALFMAEVYSRGTDSTLFYAFDFSNGIIPSRTAVTRNGAGRITAIVVDDSLLTVGVDGAGNIMSYTIESLQQSVSLNVSNRRDTVLVGTAGLRPDSANIVFTGVGSQGLPWSATHGGGTWLTITSGNGTGNGTVRWSRNPAGLSPGTYVDTVTVSVNGIGGAPHRIVDSFVVMPLPLLTAGAASRRDSALASTTTLQRDSVLVTIAGYGSTGVSWAGSHGAASWITLVVSSGTGGTWLKWTRNPSGLGIGTHVDTLRISAAGSRGGPLSVVDSFLIVLPTLSLSETTSRDSITLGSRAVRADSISLTLSGMGAAGATWSVTHGGATWITLSTTSGTGSGRVRWSRDPTGLAIGTYVDTIRVTSTMAVGVPTAIVDSLIVYEPLVAAGCAVDHFILATCLTPVQQVFMDDTGNRDGNFNLGDLLAWLDRKNIALSPAILAELLDKNESKGLTRGGRPVP